MYVCVYLHALHKLVVVLLTVLIVLVSVAHVHLVHQHLALFWVNVVASGCLEPDPVLLAAALDVAAAAPSAAAVRDALYTASHAALDASCAASHARDAATGLLGLPALDVHHCLVQLLCVCCVLCQWCCHMAKGVSE
jgi:hypothetical protein